jgi:hypothetical protein
MKYAKPDLAFPMPVISVIQSSTRKQVWIVMETQQHLKPPGMGTTAAYEADE